MPWNFKTAYEQHTRVLTPVGTETRTQQHMRDETDMNHIMAKYKKTGVLTHVSAKAMQYGDFSEVPDYQSGLEAIRASQMLFMELPAGLRAEFGNDPGKFVEFATNPENLETMREYGLAPKLPPVAERSTLVAEGGNQPPKAALSPSPDDPKN